MKPINLNRVRKEKARAEEKARADENSVTFGRSKAQRMLEAAQNEQAQKRLSQLKFDDD